MMKQMVRRLAVVAMAAVLCGGRSYGELPDRASLKTQNVIVVVVDGERWSETWGEPHRANIPQRAAMAGKGVLLTEMRNTGYTITIPGHTAICTGQIEKLANNGSQSPSHPSVMQLWLAASGAPSEKAQVICAKQKLNVLAKTTDPVWASQTRPTAQCGQSDAKTTNLVIQTLKTVHPRMVVVNLADPDIKGHAKKWDEYVQAIRDSDGYVARIWETIQSDPFYRDQTALLVTNDHGRHLDSRGGFARHGCDCDGCRHIQLLAMGPDFAAGRVSDKPAEQIDIAVTTAYLMGVELPETKGRVLSELFAGAEATAKD